MSIHKNAVKVIAIICFIFFTIELFSQEQEKIIIVKKPLGTVFQLNGKNLKVNEIADITSSNSVSQKEMKIAKRNYRAMSFFSMVGGTLIGFPIGTQIGGGEPKWELAAVGAGLVIIGIPFQIGYSKHTKKAINEFYSNNYIPLRQNQLQFALKYNSIYFNYNF